MSMHLVGPHMTTTNYKKRKNKKLTDNQLKQLEQEWRAHNKQMRRQHCHSAQFDTLEEYIAYTQGKYKPKAKQDREFTPYTPRKNVFQRESQNYPSLSNNIGGTAAKKEPNVYTGDLIVGIGTMHKSNAVPIMRGTNEAKEIARMRR